MKMFLDRISLNQIYRATRAELSEHRGKDNCGFFVRLLPISKFTAKSVRQSII